MFALETAAGESNSLFLMCGRASTTRYDDVVGEVLQTVLLIERKRTEREQTPSRFFVKGLNEVQGFENVSCEQNRYFLGMRKQSNKTGKIEELRCDLSKVARTQRCSGEA